ncbi:hypothetical protein MGN70_012260 [Eutypa lata]|nr:hypothetical protein MGN70_012260 [Eutypa lata]
MSSEKQAEYSNDGMNSSKQPSHPPVVPEPPSPTQPDQLRLDRLNLGASQTDGSQPDEVGRACVVLYPEPSYMERECINYLADIELDHDNKGENQDVEEDREEDVKGNKEMDEGRGHVAVKAQYMANEMWELIKGLSMRRGDKEPRASLVEDAFGHIFRHFVSEFSVSQTENFTHLMTKAIYLGEAICFQAADNEWFDSKTPVPDLITKAIKEESMWVKKQLEAIELLEKEWDSVQKAQVEN